MDKFTVEILEDGRVKVTTDAVSPANHMNAESFMRFLQQQLGGETEQIKRKQAHQHTHQHAHTGHGHSH
jgi:hypothetical protein